MQTFLPHPNFDISCRWLDYRRLGKQRVEAFQILCALGDQWALKERAWRGKPHKDYKGWVNHPAVLMWKGYEEALKEYMNACIAEWCERGYNNTMRLAPFKVDAYPNWLGDDRVHETHRSALLAKDYDWYSQFGWKDTPRIEYYWPTHATL